jgi:hypothetical protein
MSYAQAFWFVANYTAAIRLNEKYLNEKGKNL